MSSDAVWGSPLPFSNFMAGRVDPDAPICHACSHHHARVEGYGNEAKPWIAGCFCGCVASGSDYLGTNVALDDYQPRSVDELASIPRPAPPTYDPGARCPIHHLPGLCVDIGLGGGRVADDGDVRGGREQQSNLRLLRDIPTVLAGVWWRAVRSRCRAGDPGRAGGDRDADRGAPAGRGWL